MKGKMKRWRVCCKRADFCRWGQVRDDDLLVSMSFVLVVVRLCSPGFLTTLVIVSRLVESGLLHGIEYMSKGSVSTMHDSEQILLHFAVQASGSIS